MQRIDDGEVRAIVNRVRRRLGGGAPATTAPDPPAGIGGGIFATVPEAVEAATAAFAQYRLMGLDRRHTVVDAIRRAMRDQAEELARMAAAETGLGRADDKLRKNLLVTDKTPGPEDLEPFVRTGDRGLTITEAAPWGVVGAVTPTTNPTSTIINNTIAITAAGNAVVFNVHPNARQVSVQNVRWINQAIVGAGGPANLVAAVAEPTIASAQELMRHPGVPLLMITGGPGVVEEARKTTKRAILAGPGNPPVVVDETADIDLAGREIVRGASFDNNLVCIDEKEVFVVDAVADALLRALQAAGAYQLQEYQLRKLERILFAEDHGPGQPGKIDPKWVGQDATAILAAIGVRPGTDIRLVIAEVPADHPLVWTEQLTPVLPVVRARDTDQAISLAIRAERGCGHTASIFSRNVDAITSMAREINVSIFVANCANLAGLGDGGEGYCSFSIATPTGEGLTRPRTFCRLRRMTVAGGLRIV